MVARYFPVVAVTLMVLADLPMTAVAQQTDPVWLVPLEQQMEKEWGCDGNYFLNHQELTMLKYQQRLIPLLELNHHQLFPTNYIWHQFAPRYDEQLIFHC